MRDSRDAGFVANPDVNDIQGLLVRCEAVTGKRPTELRAAPATIDALLKKEMGSHYVLGPMQTLAVMGVQVVEDYEAPPGILYAMSP